MLGAYLSCVRTLWFVVLDHMRHPAGLASAALGLVVAGGLRAACAAGCPPYVPCVRRGGVPLVLPRHVPPTPSSRPGPAPEGARALAVRAVPAACRDGGVGRGPSGPRVPCQLLGRPLPAGVLQSGVRLGLGGYPRGHGLGAGARAGRVLRGRGRGATAALLELWPHLYHYPLGDRLTPLHCAASAGHLPALTAMLQAGGPFGLACRAEVEGHSLRVSGLGADRNDLYVSQPPLTFASRPVYVGHATGQYLYYYTPLFGDDPPVDGWCLSG